MSDILYWSSWLAVPLATAMLMSGLLAFERDAPPLDDTAARRRAEAFARRPLLRLLWPFVRAVAGIVSRFELAELRPRLEKVLRHANQPLGLLVDELLAIQVLLALLVPTGMMAVARGVFGVWYPALLVFAPLAFFVPVSRLREQVRVRTEEIERRLPYALDVIIVCVEAGVGFEEAVARMIEASEPDHPLTEEFGLLRQELEFFDMQRALARMAERVPSDDLDRLVDAIIEGERQGTPYQRVLVNARDMIRRRQSTRIEKAASRAPTLMLLPTLFIMLSVLMILVGGVLLNATETSL